MKAGLSGKYIFFYRETFTSAVGKTAVMLTVLPTQSNNSGIPGEDFIKLKGADTTFHSAAMQNASITITH